ncbi:hypothetical protein AMTRI_Chr04g242710 [Amborella trichopoda]
MAALNSGICSKKFLSLSANTSTLEKNGSFVRPFCFPMVRERTHVRKQIKTRPLMAVLSQDVITQRAVRALTEKPVMFKVRALVTIRRKKKEDLRETIENHLEALSDNLGKKIVLELVSNEIDPRTKKGKRSEEAVLEDWYKKFNVRAEKVEYTAEFIVGSDFGVPGAIMVANNHRTEFFLESIVLEGFLEGPIQFSCNSWVQSNKDYPEKRVFFTNKPYLPTDTPAGLKDLREKELKDLRGDGHGVRKSSDRIFDYDIYNDLGDPDNGREFARPILGGPETPYPRRCRTGRPPTVTDISAETRVEKPLPIYVPRDEAFEETKQDAFSAGRLKAVLHNLIPALYASISSDNSEFKGFSEIDRLYREGLLKFNLQDEILKKLPLPKVVNDIKESSQGLLKYDTPTIISKDKFAWLRDDEFARQALAGINPVNIEKLEVFPFVSKLDPNIYGPPESAITEEHIIGSLNGMTVQQALNENKLFILDYHDIYMPFLDKINAQDGRKAYATRTIFFLSALGTLKPIAIELSLPTQPKRVLTPPDDATSYWLWQLAKAHVCSNDAGVHQLVNHWLRTHACIEPFILAAHRKMSEMHPIFKLLHPHMRYTLEINALARQTLINAGGVIESCFTPGQYCMELSVEAYRNHWRIDQEGLPTDLIRRGMAVKDPSQRHGLRLLIEDYPYATDGLLLWSAIESYVKEYVSFYYPNPASVLFDTELQSWYSEAKNVGHADLSEEPWWPSLTSPARLVSLLTTLIWLASAQHAALNFGQYPYGGYVPNRPPLMRRHVPDPKDPEYLCFVSDPQKYFLSALPNLLQSTNFMAVVDTLSTHSADEEYLGQRQLQGLWSGDPRAFDAYRKFSAEVQRVERVIQERNADMRFPNRCGAGVLPYELLIPSSGPGATGRGVPNSVSI